MKISEIKNGNMNKIYLVETESKKYIVRTSDFNNEFECKVLNILKYYDYKCPQIITNFELDGKYIMLYEYLEGDNPRAFDDNFFIKLAGLLVQLHAINVDFAKEEYISNEENLEKLNSYYEKALQSRYLKNDIDYVKVLYDEVSNVDLEQFKKCIIHSDVKKENMIQDGNNLFLIDFGNCYLGSRLIDVIRVIMWFFIKSHNYDYRQIELFISTYFRNNQLTEIEMANIDALIKYCITYNLLKDVSLNEDGVLTDYYIENNSLNWLRELKEEEKILKIGELFKNA